MKFYWNLCTQRHFFERNSCFQPIVLSKLLLFWQLHFQTQGWWNASSLLLIGQGFRRSGSVWFFFLSSAQTSFMVFSNHEWFQFLSFKCSNYLLLLYRQNACFCLLHLHSCTVLSEGLGAHHSRGTLGHKQLLPQLSLLLHESFQAQEGSSELQHSQNSINKIIKDHLAKCQAK